MSLKYAQGAVVEPGSNEWPPEVELIASALEAGQSAAAGDDEAGHPFDRRALHRRRYRVIAQLQLFTDRPGTPPWCLYVRDADRRGLGFLTPHRLPLGYGGRLEVLAPDGTPLQLHCTLLRCRETVKDWFEGALAFNREQFQFDGG